MSAIVDVEYAQGVDASAEDARLAHWAASALTGHERAEVAVRITGEAEMRDLNRRFRDQDRPTNVLAFPADLPPGADLPLLGDVVICYPVVEREAAEQGKAVAAHLAHMVVHGVLHLLGYDHETPEQAQDMEAREIAILAGLGFADPYTVSN